MGAWEREAKWKKQRGNGCSLKTEEVKGRRDNGRTDEGRNRHGEMR